MEDMKVTDLSALTVDPNNARVHNRRNAEMIEDSLQSLGAGRSILIDEDYTIMCGNGTAEAAAQVGIDKVLVVPVDGRTLVAVQRTDLTPLEKRRMALMDNRASDLAGWNPKALTQLAEDGIDLTALFDTEELEAVLLTAEEPDATLPDAPQEDRGIIIQYNIVFENVRQQDAWFTFVRYLKGKYPDAETLGERLLAYAEDLEIVDGEG